jgi:thiosulfate/3-mercaptopyruvate sulfurtransferase
MANFPLDVNYTDAMLSALLLAAAVGYAHPEQLVDTAWVAAHAADPRVRIVDVRRSGFEQGHVPRAVWLDPESIRDTANPPSFMLSVPRFEQAMAQLGVANDTRVVLYDDRGGLLAARVWWMLNAYGHSNVALVDGGWVKWTAENRPITSETSPVSAARFTATLHPEWLATVDDVRAAIGRTGTRILDARTTAEIDGSDTRLSSRGGVIPSAVPVYWEDLLDPVTKTFKPAAELQAIYQRAGVQTSDTVIAYCWVGHRSAVDLFALHLIGHGRLRNYLGSWEEWSKRMDLPTEPYRK